VPVSEETVRLLRQERRRRLAKVGLLQTGLDGDLPAGRQHLDRFD
jgi:hypothetical protein